MRGPREQLHDRVTQTEPRRCKAAINIPAYQQAERAAGGR